MKNLKYISENLMSCISRIHTVTKVLRTQASSLLVTLSNFSGTTISGSYVNKTIFSFSFVLTCRDRWNCSRSKGVPETDPNSSCAQIITCMLSHTASNYRPLYVRTLNIAVMALFWPFWMKKKISDNKARQKRKFYLMTAVTQHTCIHIVATFVIWKQAR